MRQQQGVAFLVGVDQYQDENLPNFSAHRPSDDVRNLADILETDKSLYYPRPEFVLVDQPIKNETLDKQLELLLSPHSAFADVLIYFSGHGYQTWEGKTKKSKEPKGYLGTYDAELTFDSDRKPDGERRGFSFERLGELLEDATHLRSLVLWIDACHSGYAIEDQFLKSALGQLPCDCAYSILASAHRAEAAYSGIFTDTIVERLAQRNAGLVNASTISDHVIKRLKGQRPVDLSSKDNLIEIMDYPIASGGQSTENTLTQASEPRVAKGPKPLPQPETTVKQSPSTTPVQATELPSKTISEARANATPPKPGGPVKFFVAYSHHDQALKEELEVHLSPLKRQGKIDLGAAGAIEAGLETEPEIAAQLEASQVILLLVTPRFMASEDIFETQLKRAMERHRAKTSRVIPIRLKRVDYKGAAFEGLQPLPAKHEPPVNQWPDQDEAFFQVVKGIRQVVETMATVAAKAPTKNVSTSTTEARYTESFTPRQPTVKSNVIQKRLELTQLLSGLPGPQLSSVIAVLRPGGTVPGASAPASERVAALMEWAEGKTGCGLDQLEEITQALINPR